MLWPQRLIGLLVAFGEQVIDRVDALGIELQQRRQVLCVGAGLQDHDVGRAFG